MASRIVRSTANAHDSVSFNVPGSPPAGLDSLASPSPCQDFGRYLVQPFRLAIAMMRALIPEGPRLPDPARPIDRTAAMTSSGLRIGKLFPLPAKSSALALSRSFFEMNRSYSGREVYSFSV